MKKLLTNEPTNSGAYQIYIKLHISKEITIGKLGRFEFAKGNYVYTGSAMKNLSQRVARHIRKEKKLKWHIDYFLADENVEIIETKIFPSLERKECEINQNTVHFRNGKSVVKGFGSSDCRNCHSHLLFVPV